MHGSDASAFAGLGVHLVKADDGVDWDTVAALHGTTGIKGTRPECAYVGGHQEGYDPSCAWCHGHEPEKPKVTHTSELVERHRITMPSVSLPGGVEAACDVAKLHAAAYARARGFELVDLMKTRRSNGQAGVEFTVHVGHGDIDLDQRVPGVLDRWRWSAAACDWWRDILNRTDGREGKILALIDDAGRARGGRITGLRAGDPRRMPGAPFDPDAKGIIRQEGFPGFGIADVINEQIQDDLAADQRPPWAKRGDPDFTDSED
jgi:hypothetical protein